MENPCLHCFDKVGYSKKDNAKYRNEMGRTPAYLNFTPELSNINRETMLEVHKFALRHFKEHGKSAWEMNKEQKDDGDTES